MVLVTNSRVDFIFTQKWNRMARGLGIILHFYFLIIFIIWFNKLKHYYYAVCLNKYVLSANVYNARQYKY